MAGWLTTVESSFSLGPSRQSLTEHFARLLKHLSSLGHVLHKLSSHADILRALAREEEGACGGPVLRTKIHDPDEDPIRALILFFN